MPASRLPTLPCRRFWRLSLAVAACLSALWLAGCGLAPKAPTSIPEVAPAKPVSSLREAPFSALPGWKDDDLREIWPAFVASCSAFVNKPAWRQPCAAARTVSPVDKASIRLFFETHFTPHQAFMPDGTDAGLMTGYYEPLLRGARKRGGPFQTPLYRRPDDLIAIQLASLYPELKGMRLRGRLQGKQIVPYYSRAEITASNRLAGKELLWVDDPVDAFFLQVQGSGRVVLTDTGETVRLAYADQNGHPYKSIGRYLIAQGELSLDQASAQGIKAWLARNPARQAELFGANPSFVFFKEERLLDPTAGPKGALGVPLTAGRSVAVDPNFIALGTPVYLASTHPADQRAMRKLVVAQDTGSAITGPLRLDYFWGFGPAAGEIAGKTRQRVAVWMLLPKGGIQTEATARRIRPNVAE